MSEQVNKEQTKGAEQENITELTDQQLAEAQGGAATRIQSESEYQKGLNGIIVDIKNANAAGIS